MQKCCVGVLLDTECHEKAYLSQKQDILSVHSLTNEERDLLNIRVAADKGVECLLENVCIFHKYYYIDRYPSLQKKCCDPFQKHKKAIKNASLRQITLDYYFNVKSKITDLKIIPGKKLCANCNLKIQEILEEINVSGELNEGASSSTDSDVKEMNCSLDTSETLSNFNESLQSIGESPVKFHSMPSASKITYGKRKLVQINDTYRAKMSNILKLSDKEVLLDQKYEENQNKVVSFDNMILKMKEKICNSNSTRAEKIQILTMAPSNWSKRKTMEEFSVTDRMVRVARLLETTNGICSLPPPRKGKSLSNDVIEAVKHFYQNNENTRIMPGMKDRVSVKKNEYEQKRLLLCTLKELYAEFKKQNKEIKIGFSKFCTLRPKWCVSAGASGTHSVCVCTIHQNVVLLLHAAQLEETYKDLIALTVCNTNNKDCMLQRCTECPGILTVEMMLRQKFEDADEVITFKQWTTVDRTQLTSQQLPVSEFIDLLSSKLLTLIPHHYISHSQSSYLKKRKELINKNEVIILMDFAENYSFHVQDEAQGYHWTHQTCTVHPVVCYYKTEENVLKHTSICFLSEDMQHDVVMVYSIQQKTIAFLKTKIPQLQKVEYFTDGCAAQYKNRKSFYNLCHHKSDFGVQAVWSFFATSHGKSPCDGIGGTVKRSTAMESLRRPLSNQITNIVEMMKHCIQKLPSITFMDLQQEDLDSLRITLNDRFTEATAIKGTRGFHYFEPLSSSSIGMKRVSSDSEFAIVVALQCTPTVSLLPNVAEGKFLSIVYDHKWYIGVVQELDRTNDDLLVNFMHPNGPSRSFYWPQQEDLCWVPFQHVLCVIDVPSLATTRGQYHLSTQCKKKINKKWLAFQD